MASGGASSAPATASTPAAAAATTTTSKTASASLWWDPFIDLSDDLDRAAAASPSVPDALAERIKAHHAWLRGSVSMFVKPSDASRGALDASEVVVGEHRLAVKPELKAAALRLSKCMNLDEVQSYILVKRTSENTPTALVADTEEFLRLVSVQYYLERQCLLKCIRRIFVHANDCSDSIDAVREEASVLVREEVEQRLLSIVRDSLASAFSVKGGAELTISWLEETLIEINLIFDILFLFFYDNLSRCNGGLWIMLCSIFKDMLSGSYDVGKFAVSVEAKNSFHYAKAQLLFILIQTLDFESLLRMVRDEVPFSGGYSTFSVVDILEMDVEVSKLPEFAAVESGPLILAWAVFLCLVMSLPGSNTNLGPVSGFRGILRTFISAFVASYEISYQTEDSSLGMILNILCEVYDGEESLCMQFWDKDSFIDGPIRFNYLERMNGVTTLYAVPRSDTDNVNYHDQIEIHSPISIFGIEGTTIPGGSHGYILKVLEDDVALVRWEDLCLALLHADKSLAVQASQNLGYIDKHVRIDIAKIFCTSIFKYVEDFNNACVMSKTLGMLAEMLSCVPYHVFNVALDCGFFITQSGGASSDWLLSGALARMLFATSEDSGDCSSLTTTVLDFAIQVLRKGAAADDIISSFIIFSVQYIMVNHMNWKYKSYSRWKITLKVFDLVKSCIQVKSFSSKLGGIIWEILLYDSSIHSVLLHILSMSTQLLEHSHGSYCHDLKDIEDIQLVLCCGFDIVFYMLSNLPEELVPSPPFVTMVLSSSSKPLPFVTAAISLMSFQNSAIQVAAARVFSMLCFTAYKAQPQLMENAYFVVNGSEIWRLQTSISCILDEVDKVNEVVAIFNLLSSAARYQPALLISLIEQSTRAQADSDNSAHEQSSKYFVLNPSGSNPRLVEQILGYIGRSTELMDRSPSILSGVLDLLKALWESGAQFIYILEKLRSSRTFWENLSCCIRAAFASYPIDSVETVDEKKSLRYCCLGTIFEIMSYELFLQGKLLTETKTSDPAPVGSKEQKEPSVAPCPSDIVLKWFDSTTMEDCKSSIKVASCLCIIRLLTKLSSGDTGSLSFSLVKKIQLISSKLLQHHAFVALLSQYALHGYSGEQDITNLIISDLYYHIHGELEGRPITPGPFQELLCFLLEFKVFEHNPSEQLQKSFPAANGVSLFDVPHIRDELGLELWNHSDWKTYKEVAEKMLDIMHKANLMKCQVDAKLCALRSFITFLSVCTGTSSYKKFGLPGGGISITTTQSAVRCACKSLQSAVDSLPPEVDNSGVLFPPLSGQVEFLLTITRILLDHAKQSKSSRHLYPVIVLLIKTSGASTSFLFNLMPSSPALKQPVKSLLVLLLSLFEFIYKKVDMKDGSEDVNIFGELSLLSYTAKMPKWGFIVYSSHIEFPLDYGADKDGAKILQSANIFAFIKVLLSQMSLDDSCLRNSLSTQTKDVKIWGLGLAIVSSLNHCMDDDISRNSVANSTISFLSGQVPLMSSYLSAQSVNTHQSKKRTLLQKSQTSLSALSLTENILTLLCILAKYHFPRDTGMKEVDSELREIIIHLLAFISRGSERTGDSPNWNLSFGCPPIIKEEMKLNEEPPLIRSKYGWFRFAASCTLSTPSVSGPPNAGLSLVIRDKNPADSDSMKQTRFTEMLAVQIYRIAFLIMKFLCSQAKEAVRRAEELEFLDLAHFPELPMPDILHGLQDQVVSIVTEVLEANVSTALNTETQRVCQLLLVILETSLYMELCVSQSCGIRPVMGRFEDFSKGIKAMVHASEKHSSFKPLVRWNGSSHIIVDVAPDWLHIAEALGKAATPRTPLFVNFCANLFAKSVVPGMGIRKTGSSS
ncbi:hypothetical protein OsI_32774 [Oryza sativa Indica Group]|uniref:Uncharacterized protein n=1 Tax=Oryza sativa subsp. indica TaxID=39946 RepID=B8BFS0_ORYSI|nr:hypothetical protein OsI_32774 [Oryza sativa Indica Group]